MRRVMTILKYIYGWAMILIIVIAFRSCHGQNLEGTYHFQAVVNETAGDSVGIYVYSNVMYGQITVAKEEIDEINGEGYADGLGYGDTIDITFQELEGERASDLDTFRAGPRNDNVAYVRTETTDAEYANKASYNLTPNNPEYPLFPIQRVDVYRDGMAEGGEEEWLAFIEDMNAITAEYEYAAITFTEYRYNEDGYPEGFTGIVSAEGIKEEDLPSRYYSNR